MKEKKKKVLNAYSSPLLYLSIYLSMLTYRICQEFEPIHHLLYMDYQRTYVRMYVLGSRTDQKAKDR